MRVPKRILFACGCLALLIAAWGYKSADEAGWFAPSAPVSPPKAPARPAPAVQTPSRAQDSSSEKTGDLPLSPAVLQESVAPESLGELARLRAQAELKKEEVRLEEYRQKLDELRQGPKNAGIEVVSPDILAALTPPSAVPSTTSPSAPSLAASPVAPRQGIRLLGVQSSGNKTTASVSASDGSERIVVVGDTLNGARITSISRDGIRLANGKTVGW